MRLQSLGFSFQYTDFPLSKASGTETRPRFTRGAAAARAVADCYQTWVYGYTDRVIDVQ